MRQPAPDHPSMTRTEIHRWAGQWAGHVPIWLVLLAAILCVRFMVTAVRKRGLDLPYVAVNSLLTPAERTFFVVLQRALADDYHLFAKVRLGDLLQVERGVEGKRRYAAFGRIASKHADFVACDPRTFAVIGVIELDDSSHRRPDRQERDRFFDAAMAAAEIPVWRVPVQRSYAPGELRQQAREHFGSLRR